MPSDMVEVIEEHPCFVFRCHNKWKTGHNGFYSCEEHEDLFYEQFIKPSFRKLGIDLEQIDSVQGGYLK